jgi:hypothetical protein
MFSGAVYRPVSEMVPQAADSEHRKPKTLHFTDVFVIPFPEAENCSVEPTGARTSTHGETPMSGERL